MKYNFTAQQLADPQMGPAAGAVRSCVHCGICTATCPTYVVLGDERDSPRGRIVLMKEMLEKGGAPTPEAVHHIDRCLSCLNCKTACPSSVDYRRLVDQSRHHIEEHYRRPLGDRLLRWVIATVMTRPALVRIGLLLAKLGGPISKLLPGRLGAMAAIGAAARPQGPEPMRHGDQWPLGSVDPGRSRVGDRGRTICIELRRNPQARKAGRGGLRQAIPSSPGRGSVPGVRLPGASGTKPKWCATRP